MPSLLAIETTTDTCSVAVYIDKHVHIEKTLRRPKVHAEHLVPMIQDVLAYSEIQPQDLDGIAVSEGPGSYTGLRIGVSTAKGLAFAHDLKLISVPSLSAMAFISLPFVPDDSNIVIARNSRRGEVYLAAFKKTSDRTFDVLLEPSALLIENIEAELPEEVVSSDAVWVAGEGRSRMMEKLSQALKDRIIVLAGTQVSPSAGSVAYLGANYFHSGSFVDVSAYEPVYLKDFIPKLRTTSVFDRLPF
ncbi:MAG: tRNA (adenosine(37)-N6)-threonylcarbamoyltransferase complex dimerization subunit type 1 TsaB [Rhodothermaceae bacterium]|nr:tRNA (adenosine(37)-N6)-threonylcarbamoyltransferase complex dimerization subunit type 1 TsaB [Rhodothermaceae bacterium]